jgi:tetratricopeptide (TPR) repeat protein
VAYQSPDSPAAVRPVNWFTELPGVRSVTGKIKGGSGGTYGAAEAETVVESTPKPAPSPELYLSLGRLSEQSGKLGDAEQQYQHALRMAPNHPDTLLAYGRLKDRQGQLDEACRMLEQAAQVRPEHAATQNALGLCYAKRRMYEESIAALNRAVQLEPKQPLYRNNVATVLVHIGDIEAAFAHLTAVHGESVAFYNLGYLLTKKGDSRLAAEMFAKSVERNPNFTQARVWLARLNEQMAAPAAVAAGPATMMPPAGPGAPLLAPPAISDASHEIGPPATWRPGSMPREPEPPAPAPRYSTDPNGPLEDAPLPPAISRLPSVNGPAAPDRAQRQPIPFSSEPYSPRTARSAPLYLAPGTSRY